MRASPGRSLAVEVAGRQQLPGMRRFETERAPPLSVQSSFESGFGDDNGGENGDPLLPESAAGPPGAAGAPPCKGKTGKPRGPKASKTALKSDRHPQCAPCPKQLVSARHVIWQRTQRQ